MKKSLTYGGTVAETMNDDILLILTYPYLKTLLTACIWDIVDVQMFGHLGNFTNRIKGLVGKYLIICLNCVTIEKCYGTPSYDYFGHAYSSSIHIQLYTCSFFTLGQKLKNISLEIFKIIHWYPNIHYLNWERFE